MIALIWLVLAGCVCGGMYAATRILARDDMPLSVRGGERDAPADRPLWTRPALIRPALATLIAVSHGAHRA